MRTTVTGLVTRPVEAQQIIEELTRGCACDRADISLLAGGSAGEAGATLSRGVQAGGQAAATAAAALGETLRGVFGAVSRVGSHPGSIFGGALTAAGDLASILSRTTLNTVAELSQALVDFGIQEQLAHQYAEAMRQGGILVIVRAQSDRMAECARGVLATHGVGVDGFATRSGAPASRPSPN